MDLLLLLLASYLHGKNNGIHRETTFRKNTNTFPQLCISMYTMCNGLNCVPQNSYVEVLTPSISECGGIWRQGL